MEQTNDNFRRIPVLVLLLTLVGGVIGALLAEPGDFMGNTVPSTLTFAIVGLVIGLVIQLTRRRLTRND